MKRAILLNQFVKICGYPRPLQTPFVWVDRGGDQDCGGVEPSPAAYGVALSLQGEGGAAQQRQVRVGGLNGLGMGR